jgi:hypothetical protein
VSCIPFIEEQTMLKARKYIQQTLGRIGKSPAKGATETAPKPLDADAQRLVGGGKAAPCTPVKTW